MLPWADEVRINRPGDTYDFQLRNDSTLAGWDIPGSQSRALERKNHFYPMIEVFSEAFSAGAGAPSEHITLTNIIKQRSAF